MSSGPLLALKKRSLSMPNFTPEAIPQPIHKIRRSKQSHFQVDSGMRQHFPVVSLRAIKNKQEEELENKIKVISQRNLKKLEERYETIDRWKNKYIPDSSVMLLKVKQKYEEVANSFRNSVEASREQPPTQSRIECSNSQRFLPLLVRNPVSSTVLQRKNQKRQLEAELKMRLEKNKKFYQIQSQLEKEINYFQLSTDRATPLKKRQYELKKIFASIEKSNQLSSIVYQKVNLQQHPETKMSSGKKRNPKRITKNPEEKVETLICDSLVKGPRSIHAFKERLLLQATESIPQGWASPEADDQGLQQ